MSSPPRRFVHVDEAKRRYGSAQIDRLAALLWKGDPLADDVVDAFAKLPQNDGMAMFDVALRKGIAAVPDAPEALRALFDEVDRVPYWVDQEALERGGELLLRAGWFGGVALGTSLLYGYASPGGNKPLAFSGRLEQQTPRRLQETARFVQMTCLPGGLLRHSEGFAISVKVRVMHAKVRKMLLASERWSSSEWGLPVNQHDLGATSLLFSAAAIQTLEKLGFEFTEKEKHRFMQLWRYSGYLMGVDPEILPTSELEAKRLIDVVASTEAEPDEDSRRLSRALFASGENAPASSPEEKRKQLRIIRTGQGLIRGILGDELADQLDVPHHRYRHAFPAVRSFVRSVEQATRATPAPLRRQLRSRAIDLGRQYWEMLVAQSVAPFTFTPPDELLGVATNLGRIVAPRSKTALAAAVRAR